MSCELNKQNKLYCGYLENLSKLSSKRLVLELSTLDCSRTHNSTLHVLQRIALDPIALGPAPPRADPELSTVGI